MPLNQVNLKGVMYAFGTLSDVVDASGNYVIGRKYAVSADGFATSTITKLGTGYSATLIKWDATSDQIENLQTQVTALQNGLAIVESGLAQEILDRTAADATEAAAREAADTQILADLAEEAATRLANDNTEMAARIAGDATNASAIAAEELRATTREDEIDAAYKAANTAQSAALLQAFQDAMDIYADKDVRQIKTVSYANADTFNMETLLGANPVDGTHAVRFVGSNIGDDATVTGLGLSAVGTGDITFGDILLVKVDGGVIVSTEKSDDITKQIWAALTSDVTALQAATTATAIRSHFSATGWATLTNGLFEVAPSTDPNNNLATGADGKAFLDVDQTFSSAGPNGNQTINKHLIDLWGEVADISSNLLTAENGVEVLNGKVVLGGALLKNTDVSGAYDMKFSNDTTTIDGLGRLAIWNVNPDGTRGTTKTGQFITLWADSQGFNVALPAPN